MCSKTEETVTSRLTIDELLTEKQSERDEYTKKNKLKVVVVVDPYSSGKYLINELSNDIKESIKGLQIAETQLKMHEDTLKLLSISRNSLANQLREKLKNLQ